MLNRPVPLLVPGNPEKQSRQHHRRHESDTIGQLIPGRPNVRPDAWFIFLAIQLDRSGRKLSSFTFNCYMVWLLLKEDANLFEFFKYCRFKSIVGWQWLVRV